METTTNKESLRQEYANTCYLHSNALMKIEQNKKEAQILWEKLHQLETQFAELSKEEVQNVGQDSNE